MLTLVEEQRGMEPTARSKRTRSLTEGERYSNLTANGARSTFPRGRGYMDRHEAAKVVTDLFDSGYSSLVRYGFHCCGSVALAEEFAQEAFTALYKNLREGEEIRHPRAWLVKTVRNQLGKHWRRQKHGEQLVPNSDFDMLAGTTDDTGEMGPEPLKLPEYFSLLSGREEEALVLRVKGLRYRQIAEQMGVTTNSVGTLILRAVRKIRAAREKRACRDSAVQV